MYGVGSQEGRNLPFARRMEGSFWISEIYVCTLYVYMYIPQGYVHFFKTAKDRKWKRLRDRRREGRNKG